MRDDPTLDPDRLHMRLSDMRALLAKHANGFGTHSSPDNHLTGSSREAFIAALERGALRDAPNRQDSLTRSSHTMPAHGAMPVWGAA
jgi:hypothetical protein